LICGSPDVVPQSSQSSTAATAVVISSIPVLQAMPIVHLAAGARHVVALTAAGLAYTWGVNTNACCGRRYPQHITVPVPIIMPPPSSSGSSNIKKLQEEEGEEGATTLPFHINHTSRIVPAGLTHWGAWNGLNQPMSLPNDVAITHAACGTDFTILVTRSGALVTCGSNRHGQLGLPLTNDMHTGTSLATDGKNNNNNDEDYNIIPQATTVKDSSLDNVL
jgi:alpha-tubulin suppressor-like RCC1 family protein